MKIKFGAGVWFLLLVSVVAADEGPVIRGRVEDEAGKPVSGANVVAIDRDDRRIETTTDAQGAFQLPEVPEKERIQSYDVIITDAAKTRLWAEELSSMRGSVRPELKVVLTPFREVTVEVVDADGAPVEGASVLLQKSFAKVAAEKTGPEGSVKLQVPMNPEMTCIYALKSGVGYDYFSSFYRSENDGVKFDREIPKHLKLTLNGARTVRVKALDSKDQPLAGIRFHPWYINRIGNPNDCNFALFEQFKGKTGPDGIAVFDWLPNDIKGGVTFWGRDDQFSHERLHVQADNPVEEFEIHFTRKTKLAGIVLLPNGEPLGGIHVSADGTGMKIDSASAQTTTDDKGRFEMLVESEMAYILAATDEKYAGHLMGIVVREDKPVTDLELKLVKGTIVSGQVTRGPKHEPEAGQYIYLQLEPGALPAEIENLRKPDDKYQHSMHFSRSARTDVEGRFRFVTAPGKFSLRGPTHAERATLDIQGQEQVEHDFYLPRADFISLIGTVVDSDGKPVADAVVEGYYAGQRSMRYSFKAKADAEGKFKEERETQPLVLRVSSPDKRFARIVRLDEEKNEFRFELLPVVTVRGRLLDSASNPKAGENLGYYMAVHLGDEHAPFYSVFGGTATTDESGNYEVKGLAVGGKYGIGSQTVTVDKPGDIDLGETKKPEPYHEPTLKERIAKYFGQQGDLAERIAQARKFADGQFLRVMLIVGDPEDDLASKFVEQRGSEQSIMASLADFEQVVVSTADKPAMDVLKQTYDLDAERIGPLAFIVLESDGKVRAVQKWSLVNEYDKPPAQVLQEFVVQHTLPMPDAALLLEGALAQARREQKLVLLDETGTYCGWCRILTRFIERHPEVFEANFVTLRIDALRYENGQQVMQRYRSTQGGIPWCAILDADGKKLADWDGPDGNIGYPIQPNETDYFFRILSKSVSKITPEQLAKLREDLEQERKKYGH